MLLVIFGSSGTGKTSIINKLREQFGWHILKVYTTRQQRCTEIDKMHVERSEFLSMKKAGRFFAIQKVMNNYYGQLLIEVEEIIEKPNEKWTIDIAYTELKQFLPLQPHFLMVLPENSNQLRKQLESANKINRLESALKEYQEVHLPLSQEGHYGEIYFSKVINYYQRLDETVAVINEMYQGL
jgi:guanylate kinase